MKIIFLDIDGVLRIHRYEDHLYAAIGALLLNDAEIVPAVGVQRGWRCHRTPHINAEKDVVYAADKDLARREFARLIFNRVFCDPSVPFAPEAVAALRLLLTAPREDDLRIVVSSRWREAGLKSLQNLWKRRNLPGEIFDVTPILGISRGQEIEYWLSQQDDVTHYLILDDQGDMLPEQQPHFVQTNTLVGLTEDDVWQARKILNLP